VAQLPATVVIENESGVTLSNVTIGGTLNLPSPAKILADGSSLIYANGSGDFMAGLPANTSLTGPIIRLWVITRCYLPRLAFSTRHKVSLLFMIME